jgi:endo-1,4-beta-D-glucanase Y/4-amino-4-deoxy-L-arabinose transferase-like glycosyltransferase
MNLSPITRYRSASRTVAVQPELSLRAVRDLARLNWRRATNLALITAVISVALIFTGHNLFHYPQYELDEGTYVGSAWTMVSNFKLFYYTYTYSHPPLGWLQIGLWSTLTGGFAQFGMSINSGRVFMLALTALGTLIIFRVVRLQTHRSSAAAFASLLYASSPLAISLHRQVYLDNIGTFWLLVSIMVLQSSNGRLGKVVLSACAFAVAFLTKEVFAAMLPGMVFLVYSRSHPLQRRFSTALWAMTAVAGMSFFVLLALLKDELLPPGELWSSSKPHVSLITTYFHQAGRGGGGLFNLQGSFWKNAELWKKNDPVFVLAGAAALALCLAFWRKDRLAFSITVLAGLFIAFLGRGGIVIYYYVIPLLALAALAIGLVLGHAVNFAARWRVFRRVAPPVVLTAALLITGSAWARNDLNFTVDDTTSQIAAAKWVVQNLSPSSNIIMDSYAWQDLHGDVFTNGHPFLLSNYYWPMLSDTGLIQKVLDDNWQKIDYLMISPNTLADARSFDLPLLPAALKRSDTIRTFKSGNWSQSILRVRKLHQILASDDPMLVSTWTNDKTRFIVQGRVIDPATGKSTSQAQADTMLRAVYAHDHFAFDSVWNWTKANLQVRGDGLLASQWTPSTGGKGSVSVRDSMTEGDEDAALALLFASKLWNNPTYAQDAQAILNGIWQQETAQAAGGRYIVAGSWANAPGEDGAVEPIISLSAFAPYAYRIFSDADPSHPWGALVDSGYALLSQIRSSSDFGGPIGLAPAVIKISANGTLLPAGDTMAGGNAFSVSASRLPWRLAIDYLWFKDQRAKDGIDGLHFFKDQLEGSSKSLAPGYSTSGTPISGQESVAFDAGIVPSLLVTNDPNLDFANSIFATKVLASLNDGPSGPYWGKNPDDYGAQTWAWMTAAVMDGAVTNLWSGQQLMDWGRALPQGH